MEISTGDKIKAAEYAFSIIAQTDDYEKALLALIELSEILDISLKSVLIDFNNYRAK
jgi:hypothetical protein